MIKECSVNDLKTKLDHKENFILIDCREQDEWDQVHIEAAILMPLSHVETTYHGKLPDKNAEIVIHCRSGARSLNLCQFLSAHGYTNLTNVRGGILGWINAGLAVKGNNV